MIAPALHAAVVFASTAFAQAPPASDSTPASAPAAVAPMASELAQWLVDDGRHLGHLLGRDQPAASAQQVQGLIAAATEIDPRCADAWLWLFDLQSRLGHDAEARRALEQYVRLEPANESAAMQYIAMSLAELQSAEARGAYLVERLKEPQWPPAVRSDLHRRLAEYFRERADREQAGRQIERSLRLMPLNLSARELAYELFQGGADDSAAARVELALQMIRINPSQVRILWELGQLLDGCALHAEARAWYRRAIETHRRASGGDVPPEYACEVAASFASDGEYKECLRTLQPVIDAHPDFVRARLLKAYVAGRAARGDSAMGQTVTAELDAVAARYDAAIDRIVAARDYAAAAEMAWFYAFVRPNSTKALRLAEAAMAAPFPDQTARRAYGFALALNQRLDEAAAQLEPLADVDQMAAYGLARVRLGQNRRDDAIAILDKAVALRATGQGFDQVADLMRSLGRSPPARPTHPRIVAALKAFDQRVLDFFVAPAETLRLTLAFVDNPLPAAGPVRVRLRLENINPPDSFAVTLGDGLMVRPRVVLSAAIAPLSGDAVRRTFANYTEINLQRRPVLAPGEAIEVQIRADVGLFREELLRRAAEPRRVELTGILDPAAVGDGYVAGLGSVYATAIQAERTTLSTDPAAISDLTAWATDSSAARRVDAAVKLGTLIAIRDRTPGSWPPAAAMGAAGVDQALRRLTADRDWIVRAYALDALNWGRPAVAELAPEAVDQLRNEHPVVRMMAMRLFVRPGTKSFKQFLEERSGRDESPAVRLMAKGLLEWRSAPDFPEVFLGIDQYWEDEAKRREEQRIKPKGPRGK